VKAWRYYQIYLHKAEPTQADLLLLEGIYPLLQTHQACIDRSFFIRYAEGGYHIRLRVFGELEPIDQQFYPALREQLNHHFANVAGAPRIAEYEPEFEKYGGDQGLELAETHFDFSSQLVFRLLKAAEQPRSLWLGALMRTLAGCLTDDEQILWLRSYAEYWLNPTQIPNPELYSLLERQFEQKRALLPKLVQLSDHELCRDWAIHLREQIRALEALEADQQLQSIMFRYLSPLLTRLDDYPRFQKYPLTYLVILPNYLHMLNNRAGINIAQEAQLAYLLYRQRAAADNVLPFPLLLEPQLLMQKSEPIN